MKLCLMCLLLVIPIVPSLEGTHVVPVKKKIILEPYQIVYNTLMESGIDSVSAQIMTAQASFESGFFKNSLTEKSNNCFAIHHTSRRFTYSLGKGGEAEGHNLFARFSSLDSAARDFPYFLKYLGVSTRIKDEYQYAYLLKSKNYYGSSADLYARGIVIHRKLLFK